LRAYTARSERYPLFKIGVFGNKWMQYAVGSSLLLLLAVIYVPFLQPFFKTFPPTLEDWLVMTPLFLVSSVAAELTKVFLRRRASLAGLEALQIVHLAAMMRFVSGSRRKNEL